MKKLKYLRVNFYVKAIIGAGIGGCSVAYFLEDLFRIDNEFELQIDIYDKEKEIGGQSSRFEYQGYEYDSYPINIDFTQVYMNHFAKESGKF